ATATGGSATAVGAEAVINIASSVVPTNNISADLNSQILRVSSIWRGLGAWEFPRRCRILPQLKGQTRQCCTRNRQFTKRRLQVALKGFVNDWFLFIPRWVEDATQQTPDAAVSTLGCFQPCPPPLPRDTMRRVMSKAIEDIRWVASEIEDLAILLRVH